MKHFVNCQHRKRSPPLVRKYFYQQNSQCKNKRYLCPCAGEYHELKKICKMEANAKHKNTPRIMSVFRAANMPGKKIDIIIVTWLTNLMNDASGLKDHRMLAPLKATYVRRQIMAGGRVSPRRRELFFTAKRTEIPAKASQKYLFSGFSRSASGFQIGVRQQWPEY